MTLENEVKNNVLVANNNILQVFSSPMQSK